MSKLKLNKLLKESEGLSRGEKFGLEEVGEQIVQHHKRLNDMLFKYMAGVKKYASNHRKNPELYKKLSDLYTHIKGNYYYTTKQAANKYLSKFEKQYKSLVSEGKLKEAPTSKATVASPKNWVDNMWNASGNLLNVVYWLSSLQLKAPKEIKQDKKLKKIIDGL